MKFEKIHLDDITRCYCASHMTIDDQLYAFFASENPESICKSYSGKDFANQEIVWNDRGGCMSIIPFQTRRGQFLAVNEFYLKVTPSLAKIVYGKKTETGWEIKDLLSLPYVHRFDIYHVGDVDYLICATIARNKQNKEDWSEPGQIYVGVIPENIEEGVKLEQIADGCYRNHGYCRGHYDGTVCGYFTSDQGILRVLPPHGEQEEWSVEKIMEGQIGEIALCDIDQDGEEEIMTIEPFHGNTIHIYKQKNHAWERVYTYPTEIDFAHTLVGGTLCGVNSFIGGVRRVNAELFAVQYINGAFQTIVIEQGVGPANIDLVHTADADYILSANHTHNEAAVYKVTAGE
jgi:hypothetical protein